MKPFTPRSIRFALSAVLVLAMLCLSACDLFKGPNLRALANADVALASASSFKLTITNIATGTTNPAGSVSVKDGYPTDIVATAQQEVALIGWRQTGGAGRATLTAVDATTVRVSLTGGDATIEPVYEVRPVVLYSTPIGTNIAKNSSVRVVFNREVDQTGVNWVDMFSLRKQGTMDIDFGASAKTGSTAVVFKPITAAEMLDDFTPYVVTLKAGIKAKIDFGASPYSGITFLNKDVLLRNDYNTSFQTGKDNDLFPPSSGNFNLQSLSGNQYYTDSRTVLLSQVFAMDDSGDSGVASVYVANNSDTSYAVSDFTPNMNIPWTLAAGEGEQNVSMLFEDVYGNLTPDTSATTRSILLDLTPPSINSFSVVPAPNAPGFTASTTVNLNLSASDPDIAGTGSPGSGESANGVDLSEQKQYRLSNDQVNWSGWTTFQASPGAWPLAGGADGNRTVYVQVRDGVGNASPTASAAITVDATAPAVSTLLSSGNLYTNNPSRDITLVLTASDGGSGLYQVALGTSAGLESNSAYTASYQGGSTFQGSPIPSGNLSGQSLGAIPFSDTLNLKVSSGEGSKPINLTVTDAAGNTKNLTSTVILDTTAPTTPGVNPLLINGSATPPSTPNTVVALTLSASDNLTGVASMGIQTVEGNSPDINSAVWVPYATSYNLALEPLTQNGVQYVFVWYRDGAGNTTASPVSATIVYNNNPPTGALTVTTPTAPYFRTSTGIINLSWSASIAGGAKLLQVDISNTSNGPWYNLYTAPATPNSTSQSGSIPSWDIASASYGGVSTNGIRYITLKITASNTLFVTRTALVRFDSTIPTITSLSAIGTGGTWAINSADPIVANRFATLSATLSDNISSAVNLLYQISNNTAGPWTTVASPPGTGIVTASTWDPTSAIYGGTATQGYKPIYIKAIDETGNPTAPTLLGQVFWDTANPVVSTMVINAGNTYANNASGLVNLNSISATDTGGSGVTHMAFSNNGSAWSPWITYASSYANWDLTNATYGGSATEGNRTVYIKVKDASGRVSTTSSDSIFWDRTKPVPGTITTSATPTTSSRGIAITHSVTDTGGSGVTEVQIYSNGHYSGWQPWPLTSARLTPLNGAKNVQVQYKDAAGNVSSFTPFGTITTLSQGWNNLSRNEITATNYNNAMPAATDDVSYITIGLGNSILLDPALSGDSHCFVYVTSTGAVGVLSYSISGTALTIGFKTYTSGGTSTTVNSGSLSYTSGTHYYVNLDSTTWNRTIPAKLILDPGWDLSISYNGTSFYLYPRNTAKFIRY